MYCYIISWFLQVYFWCLLHNKFIIWQVLKYKLNKKREYSKFISYSTRSELCGYVYDIIIRVSGWSYTYFNSVVLEDQEIHNSPTWRKAKHNIHKLFAKDYFSHIEVKIYDPKCSFVPTIFLLQLDIKAIAYYQVKQNRLLKFLEENVLNYWNAMSLFGFGSIKAKSRPAVVVFVQPNAIPNWNCLACRLAQFLTTFNIR